MKDRECSYVGEEVKSIGVRGRIQMLTLTLIYLINTCLAESTKTTKVQSKRPFIALARKRQMQEVF